MEWSMEMVELKEYPDSRMVRDLALTLENEEEVNFSLYGLYFNIFIRSDEGYDVNVYESEKDLLDDDCECDDGGCCTGCSVDAIEFMLPKRQPTGNGGKNSFYNITEAADLDDLAVLWNLDPFMANELKTLMANVGARHAGTTTLREAKKAFHYAERRVRKEMLLKDFITFIPDMEILAEIVNEQSNRDQAVFLTYLDCWKNS